MGLDMRQAQSDMENFKKTHPPHPAAKCGFFAIDDGLLQSRNQAGRIPAPATGGLHLGVELIDQRGHRQLCAAGSRLG